MRRGSAISYAGGRSPRSRYAPWAAGLGLLLACPIAFAPPQAGDDNAPAKGSGVAEGELPSLTLGGRNKRGNDAEQPVEPSEARADERPSGWGRPAGAKRVPRIWDFEDRITEDGIIIAFPPGWSSGNPAPPLEPRQGYPFWNEPVYSNEHASSGSYSFKLPTKGGSTAAVVEVGSVPAMPGSDYVVTANVRTEGLVHARAIVMTRFLMTLGGDAGGGGARQAGVAGQRFAVVPGSEWVSAPVLSSGGWTPISLTLAGDERADFVQIELRLVQPIELADRPPRAHEAMPSDVSGAAYFDDVVLYQVPKLSITTGSPSNIIVGPEPVELGLDVRDLTGEALEARVWVWDMHGDLVDATNLSSVHTSSDTGWRPELPGYGWYRATMGVRSDTALVGVSSVDFLYLAPHDDGPSAKQRFGVIAEGLTEGELRLLPGVVRNLGLGAATLGAWGELSSSGVIDERHGGGDDDGSERVVLFDRAVDLLLEDRVDLAFVLGRVPAALSRGARVEVDDPLGMLAGPEEEWIGSIDGLLTRYGERVTRWQVGATDARDAFARPGVVDTLRKVQRSMRRLVPGVTVLVPWDVEHTLGELAVWAQGDDGESASASAARVGAVVLRLPEVIPVTSVPHYVRAIPAGLDVSMVIELPSEERYGRPAVVDELGKRVALAWEAGIERQSIASPWVWRPTDRGGQLRPTAAGAVFREMARALADRTPMGRLPIGEGKTVIIGGGSATGVLIAWNDYARGSDAEIRAYLGPGRVTVSDLFGNTYPATVEDGQHVIRLGASPVIVEGVDADLLRFWAAMRFEPAEIPSRAQRHDLELVLENPWPVTISGRLRFDDPEAWNFEPRVVSFALRRGERQRIPVSVTLGVGESSGPRRVDVELELKADRKRYGPLRLPVMTSLGLETVTMSANYRVVRGPTGKADRVAVVILATNLGDAPISLEGFAQAPGFRTQQAPIIGIEPGDSLSATFYFDDVEGTLRSGGRIRVGVREQRGNGRLNKTLTIR